MAHPDVGDDADIGSDEFGRFGERARLAHAYFDNGEGIIGTHLPHGQGDPEESIVIAISFQGICIALPQQKSDHVFAGGLARTAGHSDYFSARI